MIVSFNKLANEAYYRVEIWLFRKYSKLTLDELEVLGDRKYLNKINVYEIIAELINTLNEIISEIYETLEYRDSKSYSICLTIEELDFIITLEKGNSNDLNQKNPTFERKRLTSYAMQKYSIA